MAHWLVTGGAGFIGSHIVETLVSMGEKVRVLDNFCAGNRKNLSRANSKIDLTVGDIRDEKAVARSLKGIDYVLHQAAMRSVPQSIEKPKECNSINVDGTLNCLLGSVKAKVKRFVLASSSSVYGDSKSFPQKETTFPQPISPYAVSKLTGEHYCQVFRKTYGLSTVSLRYFNVFGPRQDPASKYAVVIPKFILSALKGAPLEIHWDGKQARDFTYVSNVVQANLHAARSGTLRNHVYNVACGSSISLLDMVSILEKIIGRKLKKNFTPKRAGDVRKTRGDISLILKDLKLPTPVGFEDGFKMTFDFFSQKS